MQEDTKVKNSRDAVYLVAIMKVNADGITYTVVLSLMVLNNSLTLKCLLMVNIFYQQEQYNLRIPLRWWQAGRRENIDFAPLRARAEWRA